MIAGDIIALSPADSFLPHLLIEVGGPGKRLGPAFAELLEHPLPPGFSALVVRFVARHRWYYVDESQRFDSLGDALDALRER